MIEIFLRVFSIFAMVGIGFVLNRRDVLPSESVKYLTSLLLTVAAPCLNFSSIVSIDFTEEKVRPMLECTVGIIFYYILAFIISIIAIKLIKFRPSKDIGVMIVAMSGINCAFMGFPVTRSIFGDEYLFYMVIINALSAFYVFFAAIAEMNYGEKNVKKFNLSHSLKGMINLPFVATLVALSFFFTKTKVDKIVLDLIKTIGDMTIPLSLIIIGVQLARRKLKDLLSNFPYLVASLVKLIILPGLMFLITSLFPITKVARIVLILATCFPTATISTSIAYKYKKNDTLIAEITAITTVFSLVTVSVWCMFLSSLL